MNDTIKDINENILLTDSILAWNDINDEDTQMFKNQLCIMKALRCIIIDTINKSIR